MGRTKRAQTESSSEATKKKQRRKRIVESDEEEEVEAPPQEKPKRPKRAQKQTESSDEAEETPKGKPKRARIDSESDEEVQAEKKQRNWYRIGYNPYAPSDSHNKRFLQGQIEICMKCKGGCATTNFRGHFNVHIELGQATEAEFLDYLVLSRAKKAQLCLNPVLPLSLILDCVRLGNVDHLVDRLTQCGITIQDDKCMNRIEPFKVGDDLMQKDVYGMYGPRPPKLSQETKKIAKNEFETTWHESEPIDEDKRKEWIKFITKQLEGKAEAPHVKIEKLKWAKFIPLEEFTQPKSIRLGTITNAWLQKVKQIFQSINLVGKLDRKFYKEMPAEISRFPSVSTLKADQLAKTKLDEIQAIFSPAKGDHARTLLFYSLIVKSLLGPRVNLHDVLPALVKELTQLLAVSIKDFMRRQATVKDFYNGKERHIECLDKGLPEKIYLLDLQIMLRLLGRANLAISIEDGAAHSTLELSPIDAESTDEDEHPTISLALLSDQGFVFRAL